MTRRRRWSIAAATVVAVGAGVVRAETPPPERRLFVRISPGASYLHESWARSARAPGAVFSGAGTSIELAVGTSVRPHLVAGGSWQLIAVPGTDQPPPH